MKRNIAYTFIVLIVMAIASCTKDAPVADIEQKLPPMAISSFGLSPQLTGPFLNTNTLTFVFGASTTNTQPGSFDLAFYETNVVNKVTVYTFTDSVHFDSWKVKGSIDAQAVPTTYPNTSVYQGTITWKLNDSKFVAGKKYSVRAYIRPSGNTAAYTPYQLKVDNLLTIVAAQ